MKHRAFFRTHPVFTGEELAQHLAAKGAVGPRTQEALLAYYKKTGRLISVRRGVYAVVPEGADPASYPVDPFLIAAKLTRDAVLSHHTALEFHGYAYSLHQHFAYTAARPLPTFTFRGYTFRGVHVPTTLRRAGQQDFGVFPTERLGVEIRVTNLERTLVDVLARPALAGGWEEVWRSLESVEFFDLDQVVAYVRLLGNATTAAKVGFFLEQHRDALMVAEEHLQALWKLRPHQPRYLERSKRKEGRLVPKWNLIVPLELLEQTWAEVL